MDLKRVFHVNAGDGDRSYAKNSLMQQSAVAQGKRAIEEAIFDYFRSNVCSGIDPVFVLADLGCSSGPNTVSFVSNAVVAVVEACRRLGRRPPTMQAFLNDLPGNDFNTLFRELPRKWTGENEVAAPPCFVAGVPGSFYERLFPDNTVHFFHAAYAAQFLSQVPPELSKEGSIVNKGCIYASRSGDKRVSQAYYEQYRKDFGTFLRRRAEEMVNGGKMFLFLPARKENDPGNSSMADILQILADILMDMAKHGNLEEEKVDYLNFATYFASPEEVEIEIGKEGSFSIELLELFLVELPGVHPSDIELDDSKDTIGVLEARTIRAVMESVLAAHLGEDVMDVIFERFAAALDKYFLKNAASLPAMMVSLEKNRGE